MPKDLNIIFVAIGAIVGFLILLSLLVFQVTL